MSTRAYIGYVADGLYKFVYLHHGHPDEVVPVLKNFQLPEIKEIVALGSMSTIKKNIHPSDDSEHSFYLPEDDVCVFYHRDRNEEDTGPHEVDFNQMEHLIDRLLVNGQDIEFLYVYQDKAWRVIDNRNFSSYFPQLK